LGANINIFFEIPNFFPQKNKGKDKSYPNTRQNGKTDGASGFANRLNGMTMWADGFAGRKNGNPRESSDFSNRKNGNL
jgi:hypothetical protein